MCGLLILDLMSNGKTVSVDSSEFIDECRSAKRHVVIDEFRHVLYINGLCLYQMKSMTYSNQLAKVNLNHVLNLNQSLLEKEGKQLGIMQILIQNPL